MTRVVSYNILAGGHSGFREHRRRTEQLVRIIRSAQPDIVGIVEAINHYDRARPWVIEEVAEQLDMQLILPEQDACVLPYNYYQIVLMTRLPVVYQRMHTHPDIHRILLEVCVQEASGHTLTAFVTHLKAAFSSYRGGDYIRLREIREIVRIMSSARELGQPHLLMGDFNSLAPGDTLRASELLRYVIWLDEARRKEDVGDGNPGLDYVVPPSLRFLYPLLRTIPQSQLLSGLMDAAASLYAPRRTIRFLHDAGYVDCYRALHPKAHGFTFSTTRPAGRIDYIFADSVLAPRLEYCDVITEADGLPARDASDHLALTATYAPVPISSDTEKQLPTSTTVGAH
jgi:endonuclease/exonuclease/phosphatase family metal-dependent hydrolase